jgi:hypothetical protein
MTQQRAARTIKKIKLGTVSNCTINIITITSTVVFSQFYSVDVDLSLDSGVVPFLIDTVLEKSD